MPWYKFEARHGGEHQAESIEYEWYDEKLSEEMKKMEWEDWATREMWEDSKGSVTYVKRLPASIKAEKVNYYKQVIEDAQAMLNRLERRKKDTPITKEKEENESSSLR